MQCGHNLLRARNAAVRTPSGSGAAPQSGSIRGYPLRPVSPPTAADSRVAERVYAPAYKHPLRAPLGCDSARLKFRAGSASRSPEAAHLNVDYHELTNGRWGTPSTPSKLKRSPHAPPSRPRANHSTPQCSPARLSRTSAHTRTHTHTDTRTHAHARTHECKAPRTRASPPPPPSRRR